MESIEVSMISLMDELVGIRATGEWLFVSALALLLYSTWASCV